jgi:hypothetical protein
MVTFSNVFKKSEGAVSYSKEFQPINFDLAKSMPAQSPSAVYFDPMSLIDAAGYKDRPFSLSYDILKKMAAKNAVISAIILTRINQVSNFTKPAKFSEDGLGYEIKLRDPKASPTDEQKKVILALELFLENCGFDDDMDRDSFDTFVKKILRDSLTYDQVAFEVVPDKKGRPAEILAVDAATIRAASEKDKDAVYAEYSNDPEKVKWVQVINGSIAAVFNSRNLAFGVRNPRTDIDIQPYGFGELEQIIQQVTAHLFAEDYNSRFFSQGGTTKGIINIKSGTNEVNLETLESFKRQWHAQVSGLTGAWKTPIMNVPGGLEYLNVSQSNREMEFEKWMNYLINVSCAVFQIDPAEVNFPNNGGVGGKGASMMEGGHKEKFNQSKDKGLKPLLTFVASLINKYVIWQFSSDFIFTFKGLNENSEKDQAELDASQVKTYKTVNEIRAEHDQDPIENGDIILDGVFVQYMSNLQQQQQQRTMMVMQQLQQAQQQQAMQNNVVQPISDTEPSQSDVNDNNSDTKKSISMKFDI